MAIESSLSKLFQTAGTTKTPTGTGYTNLNRFINANQNNQLGQKVAGNIQSQIGGVKSQLGQQQTQFQTEAEKNRLDSEANKQARDQAIGRFADASSAGGQVGQDDISKFQQFRAGQYAGPTGLQDTSALSTQAQNLAGSTSNLSPSGTQELLRRTVGDGRYTQGQQRLDTILMDRSGLRQVGREAQGLNADINRANLAAQGTAQSLQGGAKQFAADTNQALTGAMGKLDTAAQQQLAAAQQTEADRVAKLQAIQNFTSGQNRGSTSTPEQLDYLSGVLRSQGIPEEQISQLLGAGNFATGQNQYNSQLEDIRKKQLAQVAFEQFQQTNTGLEGGDQRWKGISKDYWTESPMTYADGSPMYSLDKEKVMQAFYSGALDPNKLVRKTSSDSGDTYENLGQTIQQSIPGYNQIYDPQRSAAANAFYGSRGIAGAALQQGQQEDFYKNLAASLGANSRSAQNLTAQGVASEPIRNNYAALTQLLGTPDTNPYVGTPTYQAGNIALDTAQIRRALGI